MMAILRKTNTGYIIVINIAIALSLLSFTVSYGQTIAPGLNSVLRDVVAGEEIPVIINLSDRVDVALFEHGKREFRRNKLINALRIKAETTQAPLNAFLKSRGAKRLRSLWVINGIAVTVRASVIRELAGRQGIESIRLDTVLSVPPTVHSGAAAPEWNLNAIRAPELWGLGHTGEGVVVASLDTGVDVEHPDLTNRWRGGTNSWFDPNGEHDAPHDANGHGTQIMGAILGGDAGGTAIGVAPGAQWIAAKIYNDAGEAMLSNIHLGYQWVLDPDGDPATDDAPDVVNNSWGFVNNVNECVPEFEEDIRVLKVSEIAVVFASGNEGPYASTSISPANYPESFVAGAVDEALAIAGFSSRGPSACDGGFYTEVVAPGINVKTTDLTFGGIFPDSYANVLGSSVAASHATGAMALLLSAAPHVAVSELEQSLTRSALDLGLSGPDNDYGYGLLDVMEAYNLISGPSTCTDADGDGYYVETGCGVLVDCNDADTAIHPGASETKHDGIDQDCNGHDLTIDIIKAGYNSGKDSLGVEATSALAAAAFLKLVGYGPMSWNDRKQKWSISVRPAGGEPGTIVVSGIEGSESAQVNADGKQNKPVRKK